MLIGKWPQVNIIIILFWPRYKGIKLMFMHELHGYTMLYYKEADDFLWKTRFDLYDPKWPQVDIWPHKWLNAIESLKLMHMYE